MGVSETIREEPVSIPVAIATLINAILGLFMALGYIAPEVGAAIGTIVTGSLVLVRRLVTPVEKVAQILHKPIDMVNGILSSTHITGEHESEEGHP